MRYLNFRLKDGLTARCVPRVDEQICAIFKAGMPLQV
jgi:hypothetical protein